MKKVHIGFQDKSCFESNPGNGNYTEIKGKYDLNPAQISTWKSLFSAEARSIFEKGIDHNFQIVVKNEYDYSCV